MGNNSSYAQRALVSRIGTPFWVSRTKHFKYALVLCLAWRLYSAPQLTPAANTHIQLHFWCLQQANATCVGSVPPAWTAVLIFHSKPRGWVGDVLATEECWATFVQQLYWPLQECDVLLKWREQKRNMERNGRILSQKEPSSDEMSRWRHHRTWSHDGQERESFPQTLWSCRDKGKKWRRQLPDSDRTWLSWALWGEY